MGRRSYWPLWHPVDHVPETDICCCEYCVFYLHPKTVLQLSVIGIGHVSSTGVWTYAPRQEFTHLGTSYRFSCCHYNWNGLLYFHEAFFSVKVLLTSLEWFLICVRTDKWSVGVTQGSEGVWIWSYCYSSLSAIHIGFDQTNNLFCLCRSNHLLCTLPIWPDYILTLHWFWWLRHHAACEISFMHLQINVVSRLSRSWTEHGQCHVNVMCSFQAWMWPMSIHCDW